MASSSPTSCPPPWRTASAANALDPGARSTRGGRPATEPMGSANVGPRGPGSPRPSFHRRPPIWSGSRGNCRRCRAPGLWRSNQQGDGGRHGSPVRRRAPRWPRPAAISCALLKTLNLAGQPGLQPVVRVGPLPGVPQVPWRGVRATSSNGPARPPSMVRGGS